MSGYDEDDVYEERSSSSGCLKGCLIAGVVCLILGGIAVYWVMKNIENLAVSLGAFVINAAIDQSDLPAQEKEEIKVQIARVTDAVKDGTMTDQQFEAILKGLEESPLISVIMVAGIEHKYFDKSGLDDAQKEAGRLALRRFMRGALSGDIEEADFQEAMNLITEQDENSGERLKESVTDEELLELFELVKAKADAAEIPEDVPEVDPSDEMKRIIDEALAGGGEQVEEPEEVLVE